MIEIQCSSPPKLATMASSVMPPLVCRFLICWITLAGVPMKAHVAGIAMGLIKEGNRFAVLTDILGDEDHLGDMDFKVAGTEAGITSLQMGSLWIVK